MRISSFHCVLALGAASVAGAQEVLPGSPAACLASIAPDLRPMSMCFNCAPPKAGAPRPPATRDNAVGLQQALDERAARVKAFAERCAAQFPVDRAADGTLVDLAQLHGIGGSDTLARHALNRAIAAETGVSAAERVARLRAAAVGPDLSRDAIRRIWRAVARLDQAADASAADRVGGHIALLYAYDNRGEFGEVVAEGRVIDSLASALDAAARASLAADLHVVRLNVIDAYLALGNPAKGRAALDAARASAATSLEQFDLKVRTARFDLASRLAPPIVAGRWLNAPAGTSEYLPKGKTTLLVFTAHWCASCRESYPAVARLDEAYGARGVRTVVETRLWGYFGERADVTPDEEVAADRALYVEKYGFTMPIAMATLKPREGTLERYDPNEVAYGVIGYPTFVVIDVMGKVRGVVSGAPAALAERRVAALLDQALLESRSRY